MGIDPTQGFPTTPAGRVADKLGEVERRLSALERGAQFLGTFANNGTYLRFANVPQDYRHLRVVWVAQSQRSGFANTGGRVNANGGSYSIWYFTPGAAGGTGSGQSSWYVGQIPAGSRGNDDQAALVVMEFPFYSSTNLRKHMTFRSSGGDGTNLVGGFGGGERYTDSAAITLIDLGDDVGATLGPRSRAELWAW